MEYYIKNNENDITYMSELILDTKTIDTKVNLTCQGLIRAYNLLTLSCS